jgi:hypothetical protein
LVREYATNELRADSQFLGNQLRVSGAIAAIERNAEGRPFVRLTGVNNDSVMVFFSPSETNRVINLNRGQTINIIGRCVGSNPPDGEDIGQILRILGGGKSVNIVDAVFPMSAPAALPPAPALPALNAAYTGPIDAVVILNFDFSSAKVSYSINRIRGDGSNLGHGHMNMGGYCWALMPSRKKR